MELILNSRPTLKMLQNCQLSILIATFECHDFTLLWRYVHIWKKKKKSFKCHFSMSPYFTRYKVFGLSVNEVHFALFKSYLATLLPQWEQIVYNVTWKFFYFIFYFGILKVKPSQNKQGRNFFYLHRKWCLFLKLAAEKKTPFWCS